MVRSRLFPPKKLIRADLSRVVNPRSSGLVRAGLGSPDPYCDCRNADMISTNFVTLLVSAQYLLIMCGEFCARKANVNNQSEKEEEEDVPNSIDNFQEDDDNIIDANLLFIKKLTEKYKTQKTNGGGIGSLTSNFDFPSFGRLRSRKRPSSDAEDEAEEGGRNEVSADDDEGEGSRVKKSKGT